jgi:hypothetical protein
MKKWNLEANNREEWTSLVEDGKALKGPWSQGVSINPVNPLLNTVN